MKFKIIFLLPFLCLALTSFANNDTDPPTNGEKDKKEIKENIPEGELLGIKIPIFGKGGLDINGSGMGAICPEFALRSCGSVTIKWKKAIDADGKNLQNSSVEIEVDGATYQGTVVEFNRILKPAEAGMDGDYYFDKQSGKDLKLQIIKD